MGLGRRSHQLEWATSQSTDGRNIMGFVCLHPSTLRTGAAWFNGLLGIHGGSNVTIRDDTTRRWSLTEALRGSRMDEISTADAMDRGSSVSTHDVSSIGSVDTDWESTGWSRWFFGSVQEKPPSSPPPPIRAVLGRGLHDWSARRSGLGLGWSPFDVYLVVL